MYTMMYDYECDGKTIRKLSYALLQGIVGGTYDRFIMGETAVSDPKSQLYLPADVSIRHPALRRGTPQSFLDINHIT